MYAYLYVQACLNVALPLETTGTLFARYTITNAAALQLSLLTNTKQEVHSQSPVYICISIFAKQSEMVKNK